MQTPYLDGCGLNIRSEVDPWTPFESSILRNYSYFIFFENIFLFKFSAKLRIEQTDLLIVRCAWWIADPLCLFLFLWLQTRFNSNNWSKVHPCLTESKRWPMISMRWTLRSPIMASYHQAQHRQLEGRSDSKWRSGVPSLYGPGTLSSIIAPFAVTTSWTCALNAKQTRHLLQVKNVPSLGVYATMHSTSIVSRVGSRPVKFVH